MKGHALYIVGTVLSLVALTGVAFFLGTKFPTSTDFIWTMGKGALPEVIAILLLIGLGPRVVHFVVDRVGFAVSKDKELEKRVRTARSLLRSVGNVTIMLLVSLLVLSVFSIDIRPLLAGLGIITLVLGLGLQSFIKDFVAGIGILFENQYDVGDKVKIGDFTGEVKEISLRLTTLKNEDGEISIPNGVAASSGVIKYSGKNKSASN